MINLAIIFHMHQPYYKNLLTRETDLPWVRLHGVKDYLDMVEMLEKFPKMRLVFNLVPSLIEQIEDYTSRNIHDKFLELTLKPAKDLDQQDKKFILERFFSINKDRIIALIPRYYELYFKKQRKIEFTQADYLDLQVWFNLAWIDSGFRSISPELRALAAKGRYFSEEDKQVVLCQQECILRGIIPAYNKFIQKKQIEVTTSPYYHPILPLLDTTDNAREASPASSLPAVKFSYPEDVAAQIEEAIVFHKAKFNEAPAGMWPSEESVCESVLPYIIRSGIKWIVSDEAILFKSLGKAPREAKLLYQPHRLERQEGGLNIIFRDRNLSDLIGFTYQGWDDKRSVDDFMHHLQLINKGLHGHEALVTVAMDGENAWEYYESDGRNFLELLYEKISDSKFVKAVTISEYLSGHQPKKNISHLAAGSWIYAEFSKWIGSPYKNKAWEWLALARKELEEVKGHPSTSLGASGSRVNLELAVKQMHICEGSDWFWWYGEDPSGDFDRLFRMHLRNFYTIIEKKIPEYLNAPLAP